MLAFFIFYTIEIY